MALPFDSEVPEPHSALVPPEKEDVIALLKQVARDLERLERHPTGSTGEALGLDAASRAVHLALLELEPAE